MITAPIRGVTYSSIILPYTLHSRISTRSQHEQPNCDQDHIHNGSRITPNPPRPPSIPPIVLRPHPEIRSPPENKPKEAIEQRTHKPKQVREERDDVCNDEGEDPEDGEDAGPDGPAEHGVVALVAGALEDAEEEEAGGDGGVEDAEENEGGDHEGEGHFLVEVVADGAEGRGGIVLGAGETVSHTCTSQCH